MALVLIDLYKLRQRTFAPQDFSGAMMYGVCVELEDVDECVVKGEYAPVVHGRWVWADDGYCRCSNCTQKAPVMPQYQDEPITTMTVYCPNCGAKMDGGNDDAE